MPTTFAVLGSGGWGTAVALLLAQNPKHRVRLWSAHPESAVLLSMARENTRLLPGVKLPDALQISFDSAEATDGADCWVTAIPTAYLRATLRRFANLRKADVPVVSLTKGLEVATFRRPSEIITEVLGTETVAVL
ncbi:MAG TPA: NAD(P)-binding domain-containing protein, partial [Gemmata sp.]